MFERGNRSRSLDQLRPGLLQLVLRRLQELNANTRVLLRLLEAPDWDDIGTRALHQLRNRAVF